jgi:hypothetical protein
MKSKTLDRVTLYLVFILTWPKVLLGKVRVIKKFLKFRHQIKSVKFFQDMPLTLVGDSSTSSTENFTHYDAFYFWVGCELEQRAESREQILDIGGKKLINGYLSIKHFVTSVNLSAPVDTISNVNYVIADVTQKLPFLDDQFDVFISPVSLNLIGMGRYYDNIDPKGIPNLILELQRVMKSDSVMFISLVLGQDRILFNHHFVFSFQTIETLFHGWKIENYLVDLKISNKNQHSNPRFSKNLTYTMKYFSENENIIFLKLVRNIG